MTQQDIVNELNRIVIGYNITWDKIKVDADKAIMKINAHLGAEYPMISQIMIAPHHRYTLKINGMDTPIFPERYLHTVVIPYIATEVLARDEEFTTIYNKYAMDVENGLFDMFQNEFNKVPLVFRQDKDVGVFFAPGIKEHKIHEQRNVELPEFKFNVYYHFNMKGYTPDRPFTSDIKKYDYNSNVIVKAPTFDYFINGIYYYEFLGWTLSPDDNELIAVDTVVPVLSDIHFYAKWQKTCMLTVDNLGAVRVVSGYEDKVTCLSIPRFIEGKLVKIIPESFASNCPNLLTVILPRTSLTISNNAFRGCANLYRLILPEYDYLRDYPNVSIGSNIIQYTNIDYIYIPYSVTTMGDNALINDNLKKIQCEIESAPASWSLLWAGSDLDQVKIEWGVANG